MGRVVTWNVQIRSGVEVWGARLHEDQGKVKAQGTSCSLVRACVLEMYDDFSFHICAWRNNTLRVADT